MLGAATIYVLTAVGEVSLFAWDILRWSVRPPFKIRAIFEQMMVIGYESTPVISLTAFATGSVLALQSFQGFQRFGAESMVGTVVALSTTRELGPMLTAIMVAARAGSAMAAQLGTMKVTEQIDALYTLSANPIKYLIVPRFIAATLMLPVLTVIADAVGIAGGAFIGVEVLGSNPIVYFKKTFEFLELNDIYSGLFKSMVFGATVAVICCYQGFKTKGGAEGVGQATTSAVVISSILIFILDYVLTAFLFTGA
ncbi:MAG: ABC transporter permease [Nitrospinae bacterium]|nr:ABC transporter permease [Nitrospinota bacterium]